MKKFIFIVALVLAAGVFFYQSFSNYFFQDDFFDIVLSRSQSLGSAFDIFRKPILDFVFYRPITTQLFWNLSYKQFGLNPLGYHLISFVFFSINILLVWYLVKLLTSKVSVTYLTTFLYAFSSTHFYRLFSLTQFQEIGLTCFVLLTTIFYIKRNKLSLLFFILALMSKETAVITPVILCIYDLFYKRKWSKLLTLHFLILAFYFITRFIFFGFASGSSYNYDFHPKQVLNNYFWYFLWGLGIPESFVNLKLFFVNKFNDVGQFQSFSFFNTDVFTSFGIWGGPIVVSFCLFILTALLGFTRKNLEVIFKREFLFAVSLFVFFLLPVAFFPFHKFAYSLTLPVAGLCLALAIFISNLSFRFVVFLVFFYFILSFFTQQYNLSHHWATGKAFTAKTAFTYLSSNYPDISGYHNIYFQNDDRNFCSPNRPGKNISSEVAYGIGGVEGLRLLYNIPSLQVYFWDWDKDKNLKGDSLVLDSRLFLR